MRPLTSDEKARSNDARKKTNKQLTEQRKAITLSLRKLAIGSIQRPALLTKLEMVRDVKGTPVIALLDGVEIFIDYDLYRGFIRKLKNRQVTIRIDLSSGSPAIRISHSVSYYSKDSGFIELYSLPPYQTELLTGLPVIAID